MQTNRKKFYALLTASFVLLFNPNITIVDIMPDFIAWFILARLFERAANSAPHFEEARVCFVRLGWLNLAKIPAFIIVMFVRSSDVFDNNIYALASFSFAVGEFLLIIPAVKNIFAGLFHLGERTDALSLIAPLKSSRHRELSADSVKEFTYFFVICKTVLYALPDLFLLTRVSDRGIILAFSSYYPYVLVLSQILGFTVGTVWLIRIRKYSRAVFCEGKFNGALDTFAREDSYTEFEKRTKLRSINRVMLLLTLAAFSTIELTFNSFDGDIGSTLNGVNLLPHFIYGFIMLFAVFILRKHAKVNNITLVLGALYSLVAAVGYILSVRFYWSYDLDSLANADYATKKEAVAAYIPVEIFSVIEFALAAVFLIFVAFALKSFVLTNTGRSPDSVRYHAMEKEFHASLIRRSYVLTGLGILVAAMKCVYAFTNSQVQTIFTEEGIFTASMTPWFHLAVNIAAIAYIGFTMYHTSTLKDEVKIKYSE